MTRKTIFIIIGSIILGLVIGGLVTYRYTNDKIEKANLKLREQEKKIDSLDVREAMSKEHTEQLLNLLNRNVSNYKNKIDDRDEEFKKDTTAYSTNELLNRIKSRVNNN